MFKKLLIVSATLLVMNCAFAGEHRGRIQAQGTNPKVEKSSAWNSDKPVTAQEGLQHLDKVWNSLTKAEKKDRTEAYQCAKNFILNAQKAGGVSAQVEKKCQDKNRKDPSARIDIQVITGEAFKN